jgi:hypothetical protein
MSTTNLLAMVDTDYGSRDASNLENGVSFPKKVVVVADCSAELSLAISVASQNAKREGAGQAGTSLGELESGFDYVVVKELCEASMQTYLHGMVPWPSTLIVDEQPVAHFTTCAILESPPTDAPSKLDSPEQIHQQAGTVHKAAPESVSLPSSSDEKSLPANTAHVESSVPVWKATLCTTCL